MADPTKYTPDYNFSNWQANNPKLPLPAPRVDDEYANIAVSIGQIVEAIKDVRRSDGALKNGIVTADSLSPTLKIGFTFRGTWAAGVQYAAGDGVVFNSAFYSAQTAHLSTNSNDPGDPGNPWTFLYSVDDLVTAGAISIQKANYTGDGVTTVFAVPIAPASVNNIIVEVGSVIYRTAQYSVAGTNVTISPAPSLGLPIELRVIATIAVQDLENAVYTARDTAIAAASAASASEIAAQSSEDDAEAAAAAAAATAASMLPNPPTDGYTYGRDTSTWVRLPTATPGGEWSYSTTTSPPPATGTVRFDNVTLASVTTAFVHKTDARSIDQSSMLAMIAQPGVDLFFGSENNEARWAVFTVTGAPVDAGVYLAIPVVFKSAGLAIANGEFGRLAPLGGAGSKVVTDDTPPSGPLDGQQWWRSSNGKMYVFYQDATGIGQWVEASGVAPGNTGINLAGYSTAVFAGANQSIPNGGVDTKVTSFDTIDHDPSGFWNVSTQRFQPTRAGLYLVSAKIAMVMETGRVLSGKIMKNGSLYSVIGTMLPGAAGSTNAFGTSIPVFMNGSSDYIEVFVAQSNVSGAVALLGNLTTQLRYTAFSAVYVGEAGIPQPTNRTALQQNLIVNPAMNTSQENGSTPGATSGYYAVDQWAASFITSTGVISAAQVASRTPRGSKNRFRVSVTTADTSLAAGEYLNITQFLEGSRLANLGWNGAIGTQLVLRFGFKGPAGTYSISYKNGASNRSWVSNFTVTAGQANTDIEITKIIPADTTGGTWPDTNVLGAVLAISFASGATFLAASADTWLTGNFIATAANSNGLGANTNVFELFDVGLYPDPNNTGVAPDFIAPKFDDDLFACQRYWRTFSTSISAYISGGDLQISTPIAPLMRIAPISAILVAGSSSNASAITPFTTNDRVNMVLTPTATGSTGVFNRTYSLNARM